MLRMLAGTRVFQARSKPRPAMCVRTSMRSGSTPMKKPTPGRELVLRDLEVLQGDVRERFDRCGEAAGVRRGRLDEDVDVAGGAYVPVRRKSGSSDDEMPNAGRR